MVSPVSTQSRIQSLDVLRGFAILGILIMNIQSFSMPEAAYLNPMAYGDFSAINKWVWILSHTFAAHKFMSIFSMLFGAGIFLMTSKIESQGRHPAGFHYRRIFWLLVIGLIHAYGFWYGDILVGYAMCGILVFLFRKMKPGWLILIGILSMSVGFGIYMFFGTTMDFWPPEALESTRSFWLPAIEDIQKEVHAYRGTWMDAFHQRYPMALFMESMVFLVNYSWHTGGLMLIGMGLFKWGILSAAKSNRFYLLHMAVAFILGFGLVILGLRYNFSHDWAFEYSMYQGAQFNYWGSLFVAYGYVCLVMLLIKSKFLKGCKTSLALVGRSALSNYLFQTLVCTTLFYGYGFGLFGRVSRASSLFIIVIIWALQIMLTHIWMHHFKFGPVEWLWRSLTYWKRQPLQKKGT